MLVRHNISKYTASQMLGRAWSETGNIYVGTERIVKGNKYRFRNTANLDKQPAFMGLSLLHSDNEKGQDLDNIYYYIDLENSGIYDLNISIDGVKLGFNTIKAGERKEIIFSLSKAATMRISSIDNKEDWHEIVFHRHMAASSPIEIYLPTHKTIPKENQPLLPPEGDYKEIQPR